MATLEEIERRLVWGDDDGVTVLTASHCPNCGAPLTGMHCDYCGSTLVYRHEGEELRVAPSASVTRGDRWFDTSTGLVRTYGTRSETRFDDEGGALLHPDTQFTMELSYQLEVAYKETGPPFDGTDRFWELRLRNWLSATLNSWQQKGRIVANDRPAWRNITVDYGTYGTLVTVEVWPRAASAYLRVSFFVDEGG